MSQCLRTTPLAIEIYNGPNAFDAQGVWGVSLLFLMKYGPRRFSLDRQLHRVWHRDNPLSRA